MINNIELKFGSSPNSESLSIQPTNITIFVGPNNSGKSKIISEIARQCTSGEEDNSDVILRSISFDNLSDSEANQVLVDMSAGVLSSTAGPDYTYIKHMGNNQQIYKPNFLEALKNPNNLPSRAQFSTLYCSKRTLILNGRNRIDLANDHMGGDLQEPAQTSFQKIFRDDALRQRYSNIVRKSLDSYAVIDPTFLGQLRLRLSPVAPPSAEVERGLSDVSVAFHGGAQHIASASDGAKAFTGVLAEVLAGNPKILLMDEPEAFLHPALAFNLGREIAQSLVDADKRLFVSTHSPQFVMGCIQSGVPINVIRLTYRRGNATARLLPNTEIIKLMRNPLLRSAGVISALFYESVVVTEADPDRAFYQEINERLLQRGRGISNCIFLNAQNKQTIPTIIAPLRELGIPAAAIYDIDYVKDGGSVSTRFMKAAGIPDLGQQGLTQTRAAIATALHAANPSYKTAGGIEVLPSAEKSAASDYFDQLDTYGAFVVRGGELESWLKSLGVKGHGPSWLIPMFELMGEDPSQQNYVHPNSDDVWKFVDKVAAWLQDPNRRGIPQ